MPEIFGRALLDHHRGERTEPLLQRDGEEGRTHPIEDFYFDEFGGTDRAAWLESRVDGPLLDVGAGAGRHALSFQERFETVAIEVSDALVTLLCERGVDDARRGDMFALRESFERDRFGSLLVVGTQLGLAKSIAGLRAVFEDAAHVSGPEATAVVDGYDPTWPGATDMLGFRADPTPGLAYRVLYYEYDGRAGDILLFRLFSPDRLREATAGTAWTVAEIHRPNDDYYYRAALSKDRTETADTRG